VVVDGKENTPARLHGDAGTKAATAADGSVTEGPEGSAAPAENSSSTTRDEENSSSTTRDEENSSSTTRDEENSSSTTRDEAGSPPAPAATEGELPPSTPAEAAVPAAPGAAPTAAEPSVPGPPPYGTSRPAQPKIFDLPDHNTGRRGNGADRPLVLGGAAAAEGRTSGSHPRIAGPANPPGGDGAAADEDEPRGRHFSSAGAAITDRWPLLVAAVPLLVLVLLIGAWAIDTAALSGQVMRNVQVAGRDVGGLGEASLPDVMDEINDELAARPVVVTSDDRRYETTAGEIGLTVDTEATAQAALDAGRNDSLLTRPFAWLGSFFGERDVDVQYSVKESQVVAKMLELQGPGLLAPHDPTIQLGPAGWVAVPGAPGQGVDTDEIAAELPAAAGGGGSGSDDGDGGEGDPIHVEAALVEVAPRFTDAEAQQLADQVNAMTADGITLTAGEVSETVPPATLRTWIAPTTANGKLEPTIVADAVNAAVPEIFSDLSAEPKNASFDLQNGMPVVIPSQQGVVCCGANSADLVWQALTTGAGTATLEVQTTDPEITTEAAQGLGIVQPVGGNNAWRNGAATTAGPGFTTYYDPGQPRVTNIHRIADIVRGTIILPGETFSVNETVGPRTEAKGFVLAGAIREGQHVDEIGGGVSQFATTTFNAAYFAGLDIPTYQAHTESFPRYPPGREATMGYPAPDLKIKNNTPYGVMIWTSYTGNSITVTMYSTPYATAEQTGISESMSGACRNVTTTRTRTFPDGHTDQQTFRATYRPGEGQTC
jgi:vancomycin resistance protein YoaR